MEPKNFERRVYARQRENLTDGLWTDEAGMTTHGVEVRMA